MLSPVQLFVTPWTVALQAPLSKEFSRQEYWSRLLFLLQVDFPDSGIEPMFPASLVLAGGFLHHYATWENQNYISTQNVLIHLMQLS